MPYRGRIPLRDKTRELENRPARSLFKKDLFAKRRVRPVSKVASFLKLFTSKPAPPKNKATAKPLTQIIQKIDEELGRTDGSIGGTRRRRAGVLTGQVEAAIDRVGTLDAVLKYNTPIEVVDSIPDDCDVVEASEKVGERFQLVKLKGEWVGLLGFQSTWIDLKKGDRIRLGNDYYTIEMKGKEMNCYYRWHKLCKRATRTD